MKSRDLIRLVRHFITNEEKKKYGSYLTKVFKLCVMETERELKNDSKIDGLRT